MEGKIRLGHRVYQVAVVDGDYDGKFNSFYIPSENYQYCGCDTFYVADCGGISLFSLAADEVGQSAPLGRYYKRGEQHFSISLSEDGQMLKMLPAKPAMGTLKIGNSRNLRVRLFSDAATQDINFHDTIELPVGRYQMHYGRVTYTHEDGTNFESQANFCEDTHNGQFTITTDETVTFNPGPPFTVKNSITRSNYKNQEKLYINTGLVGNEGERYGLRISRNMPEPTLKILDENNKAIHTGQMEYG